VYTLHTKGSDENSVYVSTFSTLENAIHHAFQMTWPGAKWVTECILDDPDQPELRIWEKTEGMTFVQAQRIWGDAMNAEELKEWLELTNERKPELDDPNIPKGATIEIGKAVHRPNE
jgi:hypothetical protein